MTTAESTEAPRGKKWPRVLLAALLALLLVPVGMNIYEHLSRPVIAVPDEQIAGEELLAQKFAGPRYFQPDPTRVAAPPVTDRYYITVASAKDQVGHIAQVRKLTADQVAKLNAVIDKITEPPPSRVLGESCVNTLRLNLALDELH